VGTVCSQYYLTVKVLICLCNGLLFSVSLALCCTAAYVCQLFLFNLLSLFTFYIKAQRFTQPLTAVRCCVFYADRPWRYFNVETFPCIIFIIFQQQVRRQRHYSVCLSLALYVQCGSDCDTRPQLLLTRPRSDVQLWDSSGGFGSLKIGRRKFAKSSITQPQTVWLIAQISYRVCSLS